MTEDITEFILPADDILIVGYDKDGNRKTNDEVAGCFAVNILNQSKNTNKYLVKRGTRGNMGGKMLNILSPYYAPGEESLRKDGIPKYKFCNVPENAFYYYVQFLKTKNEAFLRLAERACE